MEEETERLSEQTGMENTKETRALITHHMDMHLMSQRLWQHAEVLHITGTDEVPGNWTQD